MDQQDEENKDMFKWYGGQTNGHVNTDMVDRTLATSKFLLQIGSCGMVEPCGHTKPHKDLIKM